MNRQEEERKRADADAALATVLKAKRDIHMLDLIRNPSSTLPVAYGDTDRMVQNLMQSTEPDADPPERTSRSGGSGWWGWTGK